MNKILFKLLFNVLLHVLILFIILNYLFISIICPMTESLTNKEFEHNINNIMDSLKLPEIINSRNNPDTVRQLITDTFKINPINPENKIIIDNITNYVTSLGNSKNTLTKIQKNYTNAPDTLRDVINNSLLIESVIIIIGAIIAIILVYIISKQLGYTNLFRSLSIELLIIFACIGGVEYWFFMNAGSKYIPTNASIMIKAFKSHLSGLINNPV